MRDILIFRCLEYKLLMVSNEFHFFIDKYDIFLSLFRRERGIFLNIIVMIWIKNNWYQISQKNVSSNNFIIF